jgi:xylulokinase
MKKNEPELFERIKKIMLPKDYLNFKLTGKYATDLSDASGMLLLDVKNRCWSAEMLNVCGITEAMLPALYESYEVIGTLSDETASLLGLNPDTVVVAGAGDNAAAAVGTGTVGEGKCNISLGTSGTVFIPSDSFSVDNNNALHAFCHSDGCYHLMGCILSAASCNKWFCVSVLKTKDYSEAQKGITEDKLGKNNVYFLPYLMGERSPINDTDATGTFVGLRPDTTCEDMIQAILEGVAFAIKDNLEIVKNTGIAVKSSTVCGGGAKSKIWMQILANVLNLEIRIPETEEGPGLGAVRLAVAAEKNNKNALSTAPQAIRERIFPDPETVARYEEKYRNYRKIYPNMKSLFREIKGE